METRAPSKWGQELSRQGRLLINPCHCGRLTGSFFTLAAQAGLFLCFLLSTSDHCHLMGLPAIGCSSALCKAGEALLTGGDSCVQAAPAARPKQQCSWLPMCLDLERACRESQTRECKRLVLPATFIMDVIFF